MVTMLVPESAPSRRNWVTNLPKARGFSPVNGSIQDGVDAVITPAAGKIISFTNCGVRTELVDVRARDRRHFVASAS